MKVQSAMKYVRGELTLRFTEYVGSGRLAILANMPDGTPAATLTVNLPDVELAPFEIAVKTWSGNEGAVETLLAAGLIVPGLIRWVPVGGFDARAAICTLSTLGQGCAWIEEDRRQEAG